jgi:hypothetical protein
MSNISQIAEPIAPKKQPGWLLTVIKSPSDIWFLKCDTYMEVLETLHKHMHVYFQCVSFIDLSNPMNVHTINQDVLGNKVYKEITVNLDPRIYDKTVKDDQL